MNRIFGSSSAKPKPSLTDVIASTDLRIDSIEVKIRKLDAELTKFRDQMRKMRDGPGKVGFGGVCRAHVHAIAAGCPLARAVAHRSTSFAPRTRSSNARCGS